MMNSLSKISKYKLQELDKDDDEIEKECMYSAKTNFHSKGSSQQPFNYESNEEMDRGRTYEIKNKNENIYSKTPEVLYKRKKMDYDYKSSREQNFNRGETRTYYDYGKINPISNDNFYHYQKTSQSVELEKQISELQITINELQKQNTFLQMQLSQLSAEKSMRVGYSEYEEEMHKKNEFIIDELKTILRLDNTDDILPQIKDKILKSKNTKVKDEVILLIKF